MAFPLRRKRRLRKELEEELALRRHLLDIGDRLGAASASASSDIFPLLSERLSSVVPIKSLTIWMVDHAIQRIRALYHRRVRRPDLHVVVRDSVCVARPTLSEVVPCVVPGDSDGAGRLIQRDRGIEWELFGRVNAAVACPAEAIAGLSDRLHNAFRSSASKIRAFRDAELPKSGQLGRWWGLAERHAPQIAHIISQDERLQRAAAELLEQAPELLASRDHPVPAALISNVRVIAERMHQEGGRRAGLDASRVLAILPHLEDRSVADVLRLLSSAGPARNPRPSSPVRDLLREDLRIPRSLLELGEGGESPEVAGATIAADSVGDPSSQSWRFVVKDARIKGGAGQKAVISTSVQDCVKLESGSIENGQASFVLTCVKDASGHCKDCSADISLIVQSGDGKTLAVENVSVTCMD